MNNLKCILKSVAKIRVLLVLAAFFILFFPGVLGASPNDACFNGGCHISPAPRPIDQSLYNSNPHSIVKCIDCHVNSTSNADPNHGLFIRQLNGSNITGPLTTKYYSQNFSLCYYCHSESKIVGILPYYNVSYFHVNPSIFVTSIGTNFINNLSAGYYDGNTDYPTNIHWNHLDDFGSVGHGMGGMFDFDNDGKIDITDSYISCPACHNVHGTNYPKMTKNALAITYSSDLNGTFGYIGSNLYLNPGSDLFCNGCHVSGTTFKY
ncbi:Doubled CXXCH motif (Paired_CXXCH_1) [uncultured archaeon]|nr:Doubled CXXCH motif (Paired_CXXCH_1) [uncultured archaeon]